MLSLEWLYWQTFERRRAELNRGCFNFQFQFNSFFLDRGCGYIVSQIGFVLELWLLIFKNMFFRCSSDTTKYSSIDFRFLWPQSWMMSKGWTSLCLWVEIIVRRAEWLVAVVHLPGRFVFLAISIMKFPSDQTLPPFPYIKVSFCFACCI